MSEANDTRMLGSALLERAQRLADREQELAAHERERLLNAARERLARRRQQIEKQAEQRAEQHYRQLVQRAELDFQARLEKLRWTLIQAVLDDLRETLAQIPQDPGAYRTLLRSLIAEGCSALPGSKLFVQLNDSDHSALQDDWSKLLEKVACDKTVQLSEERCKCSGGVMLANEAQDVRLDNTFEARLERLTPVLAREIDALLFGPLERNEETPHAG